MTSEDCFGLKIDLDVISLKRSIPDGLGAKVEGLMSPLCVVCDSSSEDPPLYFGPSSSSDSMFMVVGMNMGAIGALTIPAGGRYTVPAGAIMLASGAFFCCGGGVGEFNADVKCLAGDEAVTCTTEGVLSRLGKI